MEREGRFPEATECAIAGGGSSGKISSAIRSSSSRTCGVRGNGGVFLVDVEGCRLIYESIAENA